MCGIVGYVGDKPVAPVLLGGLKRLEYRGYDSAGIALLFQDKIKLFRSVGKLENLEKCLKNEPLEGNIGIGHTRWATHGKPSEENAHPHLDCKSRIVLVHNGIIENYLDLKKQLTAKGHTFRSETDTEVLAHLIEDCFNGDLLSATQKALKKVTGSYALGVISLDSPNCIVAACKDSPLVIGVKEKESFVAALKRSDGGRSGAGSVRPGPATHYPGRTHRSNHPDSTDQTGVSNPADISTYVNYPGGVRSPVRWNYHRR